jgi:hypothetical protein
MDAPVQVITKHLDMSQMSEDKFCVLPGQRYIRISSTNGGHTVVIGNKPISIPQAFVAEALGKNAITETQLQRIQQSADPDDSMAQLKQQQLEQTKVNPVPGVDSGQRYEQIKNALLPILVAGKVEDFTTQGIPQVAALTAACGFDVTGAERDAAFSELKNHPLLEK